MEAVLETGLESIDFGLVVAARWGVVSPSAGFWSPGRGGVGMMLEENPARASGTRVAACSAIVIQAEARKRVVGLGRKEELAERVSQRPISWMARKCARVPCAEGVNLSFCCLEDGLGCCWGREGVVVKDPIIAVVPEVGGDDA